MIMSDDEELKFRIETAKLKDAKQQAEFDKAERPARENIDALLAEAAERRAKRDSIERTRRRWKEEGERQQKVLNLIFIISFGIAGLFGLAAFLAVVKYLFW